MTERFAWVDLAAGPFAWGPVDGGEGVRTHSSLPDFSAAWQGPMEDLGLGRLGGGGGEGGEGGEGEAGPSVAELEAERAVLYEVAHIYVYARAATTAVVTLTPTVTPNRDPQPYP